MKNVEKSLSLPSLQKVLQSQIDSSMRRADVRASNKMIENCYAQSSSIAIIDNEIEKTRIEIAKTSKSLLENADKKNVLSLYAAFGESEK